jgi:hypothetical protein
VLVAAALVALARQCPAQNAAGTVTYLPSRFSLAPANLVSLIPDPEATEKQFARQDAKASWGVQCPIDGSALRPGRTYKLLAVVRVKLAKDAARGPAFGIGVYDYIRRAAVLGARMRQAEDLPSDQWQTLECGEWIPAPHEQTIWIGTETGAMQYLDIDRFVIVPQENAALEALDQRLAQSPGDLALVARGGQSGCTSVELADARGLDLSVLAAGRWDANLWPNAWIGVMAYYHTPKGYTECAQLSWSSGWRGAPQPEDSPLGKAATAPAECRSGVLPGPVERNAWAPHPGLLEQFAPKDWDGRAWVCVLVRGLGTDEATLVAAFGNAQKLRLLNTRQDDSPDAGNDYAGFGGLTPSALTARVAKGRRDALFGAVAAQAGGRLPAYVLRTESPQAHVFSDQVNLGWLESAAPREPISLSLARNEWESAQVAIIPTGTETLRRVAVSVGPLSGPGGAYIPREDITLHRVEYVDVPHPSSGAPSGRWPDPLMDNAPFDVPVGENRAVWLTVQTRTGTKPGRYTGTLVVTATGVPKSSVPIDVTVWDFALPARNHLKTDFWLSWGQAERFYNAPKGLPATMQNRLIDFLNQYRIGADFAAADHVDGDNRGFTMAREADGSYSFDFSDLDRLLTRCFAGGQNDFNIALACWASQPWDHMAILDKATGKTQIYQVKGYDDPTFWPIYEAFLTAITRHMKAKGWWQFMHYQGWDEPQELRGDFEGLKRLYAFTKNKAPDLPRLITTTPNPKLYGAIDIWCPLDVFFDPAACAQRQAAGETCWWYVIGNRFNVSLPPMDARMVFWTTWKYKLSGLLYWSSDWWCGNGADGKPVNLSADPAKRWPNVPWNMGADPSGQLCYPGPTGPIASQRLEAIRDGIEDYEYLYLLRERLAKRRAAGAKLPWASEAERILAVPNEIAADKLQGLQDPGRLRDLRRQIAEMILRAG